MERCRHALDELEKLVVRMKDAQRELSRSVDRKGIDEVTGAFVTFEHQRGPPESRVEEILFFSFLLLLLII